MGGAFLVCRTDGLSDVGEFDVTTVREVVYCNGWVERQVVLKGPLLVFEQDGVHTFVIIKSLPRTVEALLHFLL